jgi:hypothetical protein
MAAKKKRTVRRRRRRSQAMLGVPTKKDFQAVAGILCRHGASAALARDFADYFRGQNPRFDGDRFVTATQRC